MRSILINASNLHVGGGVQVASSFISELYKNEEFDCSIVCSSNVYENLSTLIETDKFLNFDIFDVFGFKVLNADEKKYFSGYDVCFTVFGPFYPNINVRYHICGFAQPWIAYPKNEAYSKFSKLIQFKTRIKFFIQKQYFKNYDRLVVEQEHVKRALAIVGFDDNKIEVVSNCVSSIYDNPNTNFPIGEVFPQNDNLTLGFIGRAYPHKNLSILLAVNEILVTKYGWNFNFVFTLTASEMFDLQFDKIGNFYSVGSLSAQQCPDFYSKIDALIFPSLLECFSASPIESMKMGTPIIASDRDFIKDVCADAAIYFDPLNPNDIAASIVKLFSDNNLKNKKIQIGSNIVQSLPTASDRARNYMHIIQNALTKLQ